MAARSFAPCGLFAAVFSLVGTVSFSAELDFEKSIAPLIVRRCLGCHNASEAKGSLVLTTREGMIKGGESGPAVSPEKAESLLLERVTAGEMPPEQNGK